MTTRFDECILVTGGAGFIGSRLVSRLLRETRNSIVLLDSLTYASDLSRLRDCLSHSRLAFVQGDIRDQELTSRLFRDFPISVVLNLAAETHVDRSIAQADPFVGTNVVGTYRLAEQARLAWSNQSLGNSTQVRSPRWIQVSTDEVFGDVPSPHESAPNDAYSPSSPYSASKAAADLLLKSFSRTHGFPLIITRTCNNYGPGQHTEKFIPRMISCAMRSEPLPIFGDGAQVREWLHVDDHCAGLQAVVERGAVGCEYHFGSADRRTNRSVANAILSELNRQLLEHGASPSSSQLVEVADRPGHDRRYALDSSTGRELSWQPTIEFEKGLAQTIASMLDEIRA